MVSLVPTTAFSETTGKDNFESGFSHLTDIVTGKTATFDIRKVEPILTHILSENYLKKPDYSGGPEDTDSAYHGFTINASLDKLLRYCYNPDIPAFVSDPEAVRLSRWKSLDDPKASADPFWQSLPAPEPYRIQRGLLYLQNTPDSETGAYYGYNSYKAGILFRYQNRNVFISVSKQKEVSEVGKKGYVFRDCDSEYYVYSDKPGLNRFGLGSIKSYLYDALGLTIYIEDHPGLLKCGTYKWLNGGWAGMNLIKEKHILKGIKEFADRRKAFMESETLPATDEIISFCSQYKKLSEGELRARLQPYLTRIKAICESRDCPSGIKKSTDIDRFVNCMTADEKRSMLASAEIKQFMKTGRNRQMKLSLNHQSKNGKISQ